MIKDKFIIVHDAEITETLTGGSTQALLEFWRGWAKVTEKAYSTALQTGQWVASKSIHFFITKNEKTSQINENMQIEYRGRLYVIEMVQELDPFVISIMANASKKIS